MLRLSPFTQRFTALTLLLLFLQVTAGQCLCAAAVGPWAHMAVPKPAPAAMRYTHPGCHGHDMAEHTAAGKHQHGPAKQSHDCCKDKSAAILKALSTPPAAKLALAGPMLLALPPVLGFTFPRFTAWSREQAVMLVPPQHLPPKIPDIRVYLRSLTV
ncbi:hypothetical protein GCM10023172_42620 [Hymenobacter ginsengisoli]|uniref:Uncharacterized protein n=1 Tax=Hymenobacter ginsengisoli TaxID=1051626 RepID=A0ABP8QTF9_9BACT|nr:MULTISPECIES: hypothetical protein [unclassified Hymenobacter]MBO2033421.1 hypothetical protein [Hymenobacter sp. BT559]